MTQLNRRMIEISKKAAEGPLTKKSRLTDVDLCEISFLSGGSVGAQETADAIIVKEDNPKAISKQELENRRKTGYLFKAEEFAGNSVAEKIAKQDLVDAVSSRTEEHVHGIRLGVLDGKVEIVVFYAGMPGATYSHDHQVVRTDDGNYLLIENEGHTHVLSGDVVRTYLESIIQKGEQSFDIDVVMSNQPVLKGVTTMPEENKTPETAVEKTEDKVENQTTVIKTVTMTTEQTRHFDSLQKEEDREAFVKMTMEERNEAIIKARVDADDAPIVVDGQTITKSEDPKLYAVYKELQIVKESNQTVQFEKAAEELFKGKTGTPAVKAFILSAIDKHANGNEDLKNEAIMFVNSPVDEQVEKSGATDSNGRVSPYTTKSDVSKSNPEEGNGISQEAIAKRLNEKSGQLNKHGQPFSPRDAEIELLAEERAKSIDTGE